MLGKDLGDALFLNGNGVASGIEWLEVGGEGWERREGGENGIVC